MKPKLLTTIKDYNLTQFRQDAWAGVTVALVALPLSIAIAIASGARPATGLITAIVGGFLISALGGSRVQIGGPTGAFIVVVYGVIARYGYDGLLVATLMAGIILVIAGLFRAGQLITFIPEAVIEGFTLGIAMIIATSQLKDLLGLTTPALPAEFIGKVSTLWAARSSTNLTALFVGITTIALVVLLRRVRPRLPGMIVAVALMSAVAALFVLPVDTIASRYGVMASSLPWPRVPTITLSQLGMLVPSALVIAFLSGVESLLSAIVADRMIGGSHRSNAELLAQGVANIAAPLFGGLPATGAIARTATNVRAGAKTPVAGIIHAMTILLVMQVAAPLTGYLAMPALGGLLIVTAWSMSEPQRWPERFRMRRDDCALMFLTMVLTVLADLTVAIAVGTGIGLALRLAHRKVLPEDWNPSDEH